MAVAGLGLNCVAVATLKPLAEIATELGLSKRQMQRWVRVLEMAKYTVPGKGKVIHLDPDEVRRKMRQGQPVPRS